MSKDLKRRGFKFVGSTICYAFMQAVGMVNDHLVGCFRHSTEISPQFPTRRKVTLAAVASAVFADATISVGAIAYDDATNSNGGPMTSVPDIQAAIQLLGDDEFDAFSSWFERYEEERWDRQSHEPGLGTAAIHDGEGEGSFQGGQSYPVMTHFVNADFWFHYRRLPADVRDTADRNFALLKAAANHPSLHLEKNRRPVVRQGRSPLSRTRSQRSNRGTRRPLVLDRLARGVRPPH